MRYPKITIVTPSFNQGAFLEKTIQSVVAQNYPNLEYLIIDGGSADDSLDTIRKYEPHLSYWVSEPDKGQSHAINKGLARASGELLGWLNSDDYLLPGALEKVARAYLEDPTVGAVYGQGHIVDDDGAVIYTPLLRPVTLESLYDWCYGNDFMQPSCLFTKEAWEECGPLDESIHISLDVDLWLKIAKKYKFRRLNDVLSHSLGHAGAKTIAFRNLMKVDLALVISQHGGEKSARRILESQAKKLTELEAFWRHLGTNPLFKVVRRYISWRLKKKQVISPHWK